MSELVKLEHQDRDQLLVTARTLLAETEALSSRIAALNEIGVAINRTLDLDKILQVVAKQAKWLMDFEHCSVCLSQPEGNWQMVTLFGAVVECDLTRIYELDSIGYVLKTGQPSIVNDGAASNFLTGYQSQMIVPLVSESIIMGTIHFATRRGKYTQDDLRIGYMLALQISNAMRNATLFNELRRAQETLRQHAAELETRNQELDAYSHTIAHDLKSPLTGIIVNADLVRMRARGTLPSELEQHLLGIKDSGLRMGKMIDQLLWLAKLRDVSSTAVPVEINSVVANTTLRLQHAIAARGVTVSIAPNLPPALGHEQWVEEIFANLISNAIKYMGDHNATPFIYISATPQECFVRYDVRDNGVGIAPENQARLFEMFTRLHTVKAEGIGLGLSIVQRIVTKLGGRVGVESQFGKGSTFWFTLPAIQSS
jgi:signal transduction histidine kinase